MAANNEAAPDPITESAYDDGSNDAELLTRFQSWDKALMMRWSTWQDEARRAFEFRDGHQWDEQDIALMEERARIPVVFNLTGATVDAVCGAEIQNRQQTQYFPREVGDTGVADALSQGAAYLTDESNGDQEDSEAFRDMLTCGIGVVEYRPESDGVEVRILKERVDPLEVLYDPGSRRACFEDARYLRREIPMTHEQFEAFKDEINRPDLDGDDNGGAGKRPTIVDPQARYTHGLLGTDDQVRVCEWQWWDKEPINMAAIPQPNGGATQLVKLDDDQLRQAQALAAEIGIEIKTGKTTEKVYYRAYVTDGEVVKTDRIPGFTYKAMTGKRDHKSRTYYGLVRAMTDPQRLANKLYSETLHIVGSNAKGGLIAEEGAVSDIRQFEESWSQADAITWAKDGALSGANGPRMQPKTPPPIPSALFPMMEFARDMIRACTGVNEEILGLVGREQAGVLEHQRKQAAYGILSPFFDALRRYRRDAGRLLLILMREYLPADKLIRVVDKGTTRYVPLSQTMETEEYDIVVDEAPSGPNQKARVMAVLTPLMPWLSEAGLDDEFWADVAQYTDLPAAMSNAIAEAFKRKSENEAKMAEAAKPMQEIQQRLAMADVAEKESGAAKNAADAVYSEARAIKETTEAVEGKPKPDPSQAFGPKKGPPNE